MGIRFRKSIKLAPGIRMNFSGSGASWTVGPRGASIGIGKRGAYLNSGIPGTGLYARQRLGSGGTTAREPAVSTGSIAITVSISDDGALTFKDSQGNPIPEHQIDAVKKQHGDKIKGLIQTKCDEVNDQVQALGRLHEDTSPPYPQGLALIVIDYLQLMRGEGSNRNEELGDLTRRLKLMAKELRVPVLLLSQLSRKVEERTNKRPLMSDLRESGAIEQDADLILMVYRDEYYNAGSPDVGTAEVLITKHRMGATGEVRLAFQGEFSRFRDLARDDLARINHARVTAKMQKIKGRGFDE